MSSESERTPEREFRNHKISTTVKPFSLQEATLRYIDLAQTPQVLLDLTD